MAGGVVRIAAVADVHYGRDAESRLRPLFEEAGRRADMLLLAGDLTDYGLPEEVEPLVRDLAETVRVPVVAVLGNHDFENGKEKELTAALRAGGVRVLDGDVCEVAGIGIAVALTAGLMGLTRERRAANIALGAVMAVSAWGLFEVIYSIV